MSYTNEATCVAKETIISFLKETGCEEASVPTKIWFRLIEGQESVVKDLWMQCLRQAAPALLEEGFGKANSEEGDDDIAKVDWKRVPSTLFTYVVLGIDCLATTEDGRTLAVITTLPGQEEEVESSFGLRPLFDFLGIDGLVWCQVNLINPESMQEHKTQLISDLADLVNNTEEDWMNSFVVEFETIEPANTVTVPSLDTPTVTMNTTNNNQSTDCGHSTFTQNSTVTVNPTMTVNPNLSDATMTVNVELGTDTVTFSK